MEQKYLISKFFLAAAAAVVVWGTDIAVATAGTVCDFEECHAFVKINASTGRMGVNFLMDGGPRGSGRVRKKPCASPGCTGKEKIFRDEALGTMLDQRLSKTLVESAQSVCKKMHKEDANDEVLTVEEFVKRWRSTKILFNSGGHENKEEKWKGKAHLSASALPAAPANLMFDGSVISWDPGNDLGECASNAELNDLVADGDLRKHPQDVPVAAWKVALETESGDGTFDIRVKGNIAPRAVTVPAEFLASLPDDTPAKIRVGAIRINGNVTYSERGGFCINETLAGCP